MAQTSLMGSLSDLLFYPFMFIGLISLLSPAFWSSRIIHKFGCLYALMAVYMVYEFTFGIEYVNTKTLLYLISKLSTFAIIIVSIDSNESFYRHKGVKILVMFMAFFLCYGMATGGHVSSSTGRALAGFTNENTAGAMGALTVGMLLFYMRDRKWTIVSVVILFLGFYGVLAGGSRAGFLMLFLLVFLRYGVNIKTVAFVGLLIVAGLFILPAIGVETVGLQRMMDTYHGVEGTNRGIEREAAEWMIAEKPYVGWGYMAVNQGYAATLSELPSHNGYLEIIKQMGYPVAIVYFLILSVTIYRYWRIKISYRQKMDLFFAMSLMLLVKANYEAAFIGVHEYGTNIFFVAIAMMSARAYSLKYSSVVK
ncbi:MAG: hypothetical protein K2O12_05105 [Muribaculaceae bacterium]|nr:hypothetical protein [Muribaculaceae bacterium]